MMSGPSAFRPQGSFTALSLLAANPEAQLIAAAVIGGVAITVAGATFIYKEFKEYEEKKHLDEINFINQLHDKYLAKIPVPGRNQTLSLPVIFKMKSDKDLKSVESLYYNDDIVRAIADFLPAGTDVALSKYQVSIRNAILKLQAYYFSRSDHHDITSSVILYLIQMLDSHCLKFEGYDYDIAYLGAIAGFINEYASEDRRVNTKKFSHLDEVYSHIVNAQHMLDLHKDKLSLTEIIHDLFDSTRNLNDQYVRSFAMLTNPTNTWELIETVTLEELSTGMLKKYHVANDLLMGLITISDNEVDILNSPFRDCLLQLAAYAEKANDPDSALSLSDIPAINITVPNLKRFNELKNKKLQGKEKLTKKEKEEKSQIKNQLEELKSAFYKCENFVTTQLDPKTKKSKHKFIAVTDYAELVKRVEIIKKYAELIREIISLQYYAMNLIKGIRLLGEIDVSNINHRKVFDAVKQLCEKIISDYTMLKKDFYQIQKDNNAMKLVEQSNHRDKIYALLESTNTIIGNAKTAINNYWYKNRNISHQRKITAEHNLFNAADLIGKAHELPFAKESKKHKKKTSSKDLHKIKTKKTQQRLPLPKSLTHGIADHSLEMDKNDDLGSVPHDKSVLDKIADVKPKETLSELIRTVSSDNQNQEKLHEHSSIPDIVSKNSHEIITQPVVTISNNINHHVESKEEDTVSDKEEDTKLSSISSTHNIKPGLGDLNEIIKSKLVVIQNTINVIRKEEKPSAEDVDGTKAFNMEINAYFELYNNVANVNQKITAMLGEVNKSVERNTKIAHMFNVLASIIDQFGKFIVLNRNQRIANVLEFNQHIQKSLLDQGHSVFIDEHENEFWKMANSLFGPGYFRTDSRIRLSNISVSSNQLMNLLVDDKKPVLGVIK